MAHRSLNHLRLPGVALLAAMLTSGCLGHVYEIPRPELERLVQTPPAERGQSVFAVQQFTTAPEPDEAPPWPEPVGEPPAGYACTVDGYWVPSFYLHYGAPDEPPRQRHTATAVGSGGGTSLGSGTTTTHSSSSGSGSSKGGGGGDGGIGSLKDGGVLIVAAIVVGVAVGAGLVMSEGVRYDGTVAVHPHHPVHLVSASGQDHVVALDELSANQLRPDVKALISGQEGAGLWLRERAPLNRQGFSFQFGAGDDALALPGVVQHALGWRFATGYFPTRWMGLLIDSRLQAGDVGDNSFRDVRVGLEAQIFPVALWRLHLGAFGGAGQAWYASGGSALPSTDASRSYVDFGGLAEVDLTTHLALTFRWIEDWLPEPEPGTQRLGSSWSVGLAVY